MNRYETVGVATLVYLTYNQIAVIDTEDIPRVLCYTWHAQWSDNNQSFYAATSLKYKGKSKYLHRFIMGEPEGVKIDHKSGDTLDCRKENLREVTNSQNGQNRSNGANRNSTTGVRGVHIISGKYRIQIMAEGKRIRAGSYPLTPDGLKEAEQEALRLRSIYHTHSDGR